MRLRALVKNKVMLILVDSGSSHSFVSSAFLSKVGIKAQPANLRQVRVANAQILYSDSYVPEMEWWIQGHSFNTSMRVLDLEAYDAILGFDWLRAHNHINHDWLKRTMEFKHKGVDIFLQGVQPPQLAVQQISLETMGNG